MYILLIMVFCYIEGLTEHFSQLFWSLTVHHHSHIAASVQHIAIVSRKPFISYSCIWQLLAPSVLYCKSQGAYYMSRTEQTTSISILRALILSKVHYIIYTCRKVMCYIIRLITYYYIIIKLHQ